MTATQQEAPRSAAPAGRRSRSRRRERRGSGFLGVLVGLALAGGAVGIQSLALDSDDMALPLTYTGDRGEEVDAGRFSARVDNVETAKGIQQSDGVVATDQIFLVVTLSATVPDEPIKLTKDPAPAILLTAEGKRFAATKRVDSTLTLANRWIQPGWWAQGRVVFEVPPAVLPGSKVIVSAPNSAIYSEPLTPEAELDLGLDEEKAKQLTAAPKDVYPLAEKRR
ncbi:hypothetical protein [Nonomuraea sp. NPDC050310]|uniref:hypothetical protein n=1 Tax=unclassified Nonomuraea TaxID=2593643 RepID=UPI00340BDEB3